MKIAIPVDEKKLDAAVGTSFGRSAFFLLYDSTSKESLYLDNPGKDSSSGAGIKAAQALVDAAAQVVLSPRCGENAAQVLQAAGLRLYRTDDLSVQESIELFLSGKLPLLEDIHAGLHGNE